MVILAIPTRMYTKKVAMTSRERPVQYLVERHYVGPKWDKIELVSPVEIQQRFNKSRFALK